MSNSDKIARLGHLLHRSSETIQPKPDAEYREVTVRLWGKGVVERGGVTSREISSRRFVAHAGDFIISRIDARNGASGLVPPSLDGALVTNDFPLFKIDKQKLDPKFFEWFTRTRDFVDLCKRASEGTTNRVRLSEERFLALEVPLPPLAEQQRLVARIEELAAQIKEARTLRNQAAEEAEALFSNSRDKVFSRLESKDGMPVPELGEVARFRTGYAFKSNDYRPSGRLIFRVSNIRADGSIDKSDSVYLADELGPDYEDYQLRTGDILMVMVGGSVGKLCMIPKSVLPALMNQNMWRVNPLESVNLSAEYLFHFLHRCNRTLGVGLTKSTHGHLTQTEYKSQKIPFPPLAEQGQVVAELDALQAEVDSLKRLQTETAAELDALLPSILDKAFKGEL